jgi:hypothetical protein
VPRVRTRTKKQFRQLQNRCGNTQRLRAAGVASTQWQCGNASTPSPQRRERGRA